MFDAAFFRDSLVEQITEMGGVSASCQLRLADGSVYMVRDIKKVEERYVWLEIYPSEGVTKKSKAKRTKQFHDEVCYDRVAIPYAHIAQVFLTITEPEQRDTIGFRPQ